MSKFKSAYKGKVLLCDPISGIGGWLTSLYIREEIGNVTHETKFSPDDKIYQSPEEAAAVAELFGKRLIDENVG